MKYLKSIFLFILIFSLSAVGVFGQTTGITGDSDINKCETKSYTISIQNTSGTAITDLVIVNNITNLTGFSYASGTSVIDVDGTPVPGGSCPSLEPTGTTTLTWDMDGLCSGDFTLAAGETLNITYDLETDCTADSGTQNVTVSYAEGGDITAADTITVLPGGVTIKKTPNVIEEEVGNDVTWTIEVENSGLGIIENVVVTDVLGAGLEYVSSTEPNTVVGSGGGETITWTPTNIPALASMNPGETVSFDITATVIACDNLDNTADVRWGCDMSTDCFDTATDGGTATASVQRIVRTPLLGFTPPNITFDYCQDTESVSFVISNTGDGDAYSVRTIVDFGALNVVNVSVGASYDGGTNTFTLTDPIPAGGSYTLSFDLQHTTWCTGSFPTGDLLWQKVYEDGCGNEFYPPVELSTVTSPANTPSISITKGGAGSVIQIGDTVNYTITSSYGGPLTCGSGGNAGTVTVVDTLPAGFTVTDPDGGTWDPSAGPTGDGSTGGTITWTYDPSGAFTANIILESPPRTQCDTYCFQTFTNSVTATVTDCCGCALSDSDSQTSAIECEEGVNSEKTWTDVNGGALERCDIVEFVNTYTFDGTSTAILNDLIFEEHADNGMDYVSAPASLSVIFDGSDITGSVLVTDNTGTGGRLRLDFSGLPATSMANLVLEITYRMQITTDSFAHCGSGTFYSWSSLQMSAVGSQCLPDGIIYEASQLTVSPPAMNVSVSGLGSIIDKCDTRTITVTLSQSSAVNPRDVMLELSGLNYYVVGGISWDNAPGAIQPLDTNPVMIGDDAVWYFSDNFTGSGQTATLTIDVQKRCTDGEDLDATAYYEDQCTDDGIYHRHCSVTGTESPALLRSGDLLIEKTPEVYYADSSTIVWKIYVTNRGTGTAYNVWVDDELGSGLDYVSAVVDDVTGVITDDQDHEGNAINGATIAIPDMTPGERREITFTATLTGCTGLTNDVSTSWGCVGIECATEVTDSSTVEIPAPLLVNTSTVPTAEVESCSTTTCSIVIKNAGQTTNYNLQIDEEIPTGLEFVSGTVRWQLNAGGWSAQDVAFDPTISLPHLNWTSTEIPGLASLDPGDTIYIEFDFDTACPFTGGDIQITTDYENPCGQVFTTDEGNFSVTVQQPDLVVTKTRVDDLVGCAEQVIWEVTIQNNSGYDVPIVYVRDTLGAAFTYDAGNTDWQGGYNGIAEDYDAINNTITWELTDLTNGATATLDLYATSDDSGDPCNSDLDNTIDAWWGCGAADGDPTTHPESDEGLCLYSTAVSVTHESTREPDLAVLNLSVSPTSIASCEDNVQVTVTIENQGSKDALNLDLVIDLPTGLSYDNTVQPQVTCNGVTAAAGHPVLSNGDSTLTFYDTGNTGNNICDLLQAAGGNDRIVLVFHVNSDCYVTAETDFTIHYYDCCGDNQYDTTSSQSITATTPDLSITKTPLTSQVDCNDTVTFDIEVTNNGDGNAQVVRIEDTLGPWLTYVSSNPAATSIDAQNYYWEISDLAPTASTTVQITARLTPTTQNDCATQSLRQNNARTRWGCNSGCDSGTWVDATATLFQVPNLTLNSTDINANISCTDDGSFTDSMTVTVRNTGDAPTSDDFTVEVTDGSWTGTGTHSGAIPAGGTAVVTIDTTGWNPDCSAYTLTATIDTGDTVCECNETDNSESANYTPSIADLTVNNITFTNLTCDVGNDTFTGEVNVGIGNVGTATANNFQVTLNNTGCLNFSVNPVTVGALGGGSTTTLTFYVTGTWADCTSGSCDFTAIIDSGDDVCECDGNNNTHTETYTNTLPDLDVTNIDTTGLSCLNDNITGSVAVTVENIGHGSASNFYVALNTDGCLNFTPVEVTGTLNNGDSTTVTLTVTGPWADCGDCSCDLTAIVDSNDDICECDGTNNSETVTFDSSLPDLRVNSVSPNFTCGPDGTLAGTVTVNVENIGCAAANGAVVRLRSDCGYAEQTDTVNLGIGASTNVIFNITPNCTDCPCEFTADIDPGDLFCECSDGNNTATSGVYTPPISELTISDIDFNNITWAADTISGNVRVLVNNNGCADANNFEVALGTDGCLTFGSNQTVNSLAAGASTWVTFNISGNWGNCADTSCVFTATVDPTLAVCECNGANNTYQETYNPTYPDLIVTDINFDNICNNDSIGTISVTIRNQGSGAASTPFEVALASTGSLTFSTNQTVNSLAADSSTTVTFTPDATWADCGATDMDFTATVDPTNAIDECDGANNVSSPFSFNGLPNLTITAVATSITCVSDGNLTGTNVTIQNTGPVAANNIFVRLSSDCGLTFTDQEVTSLAAGASVDVFFPFSSGITGCSCNFTATVDPDNTICECDGTDNTGTGNQTMSIPDLEVQSTDLQVDCADDGQIRISGNVTLVNNGCGTDYTGAIPVEFTLYGGSGCSGSQVVQWTEDLSASLASSGGTQVITISTRTFNANLCTASSNCNLSVLTHVDYNESICEWDGNDNTWCQDISSQCLDLQAEAVSAEISFPDSGSQTGTISVTVRNTGSDTITSDFSILVDDGQGWTAELRYRTDLGGRLPLPAGQSDTVTFDWDRDFADLGCTQTTITSTVDSQNTICQCTADNDTVTAPFQPETPNLRPVSIEPVCDLDGTYRVNITIENNGCGDAAPFILRLEDSKGNVREIEVDSIAAGSTLTVEATAWPASCEPPTVTFTVTLDINNTVFEILETDNGSSVNYTDPSPDLVFTGFTPSTSMSSPGQVSGSFEITLLNQGNGPVTQDFKLIIDDGEGWSTEKFFNADLGGQLPINAGQTVTLRVNWNRDFSKEPIKCDYNNITAELDMQTSVCECAAGNNNTTATYHLPYPDVYVDSIIAACEADGLMSLEIVVGNNGCENQTEDFEVTFSDSTGNTKTVSFTSIGGKLPLRTGTTQTLRFTDWILDCSVATTEFNVTVGGDSLLDLTGANNTYTHSHNFNEPDLRFKDIDWTCNADGSITFRLTLSNEGNGNANSAQVTGYTESGQQILNQPVTLPAGGTQEINFTSGTFPQDQNLTFRFVVDESQNVCECDGTNNEISVTVNCPSTGEPPEQQIQVTPICGPAQGPGGLFRFELWISNFGPGDLYYVKVHGLLPEGYSYAPGTSTSNNQQLPDPTPGAELIWEIGTVPANTTIRLFFSAVADADIDPGRYCTEAWAEGSTKDDGSWTEVKKSVTSMCCTVVTREEGAGCCLRVEEWPMGPWERPDGPMSFIEPYFNTESAMFSVYAALNLWDDDSLEKSTMPRFMKERLRNYSLSTIEEFYLQSRSGVTLPDGSLWLAYGGVYPEQYKDRTKGWMQKQENRKMTPSQLAFELLALNKAYDVETKQAVKPVLKTLIQKKLQFLSNYIVALPRDWEILDRVQLEADASVEETIKKSDKQASIYDHAALYLAMTELSQAGYDTAHFAKALRKTFETSLDTNHFNTNEKHAEFLFILALLESGETPQAQSKIQAFEKILTSETPDSPKLLDALQDHALAAAIARNSGTPLHAEIIKRLQDKFFIKDTGIFADLQSDQTFKLTLSGIASLMLAFDTDQPEQQQQYSTVLYRTFDEVGLFLKKRNLQVGNPLYSLLKNYPFSDPVLPVLSFTRAKKDIAPVFSQDAVIHSTQMKPLGEVLIPQTFSKLLSPAYETDTSKVAAISTGLQYLGRKLQDNAEQVLREEGRSLDASGRKYMESLLTGGAGMMVDGMVMVPHETMATRGSKHGEFNLEPLNADNEYSTSVLADFMIAGKMYIQGAGKHEEDVKKLQLRQMEILKKFRELGYIPASFRLNIDEATQEMTVVPSEEAANKLTAAKLAFVADPELEDKLFLAALKKSEVELQPEDLLFFAMAPEFVDYFKKEIKIVVDHKDSAVSFNAADVIGRRLLGDNDKKIRESLENLAKHWDNEAVIPKSDKVENIEKGIILHHEPRRLVLYLLALEDAAEEFRFKRTLNFFTYLLENEWGVEWDNSFITLPSAEYRVFREEPKEIAEPGDLLRFRVRVDNTCPDGYARGKDLPSLFLKATFNPSLVYAGTEPVDGLDVLGDFKWRYNGFPEGSVLEFTYQALMRDDLNYDFLNGSIYAGGRQGYEDFGPGSGSGDICEDTDEVRRLQVVPFEELQGVVFEDKNLNGVKDGAGEAGIPNILLKDTRGRVFRSDAEGRFTILAGDRHEGIQLELKSLPPQYILEQHPTVLVNRRYVGEVYFPLIPCKNVKGFVFEDANGNGQYDEGEVKPSGVLLQANEKEVVTGKDGWFLFRNLPVQWQKDIGLSDEQPYYKSDKAILIRF